MHNVNVHNVTVQVGHADDGTQVVCIRNPWGQHGPLEDQLTEVALSVEDDGMFQLDFDTFVE